MTGLWRSFLKAWSLSGLSASLPPKGTSLFVIAETLSRDQGPLGPIEILLSKEQQRGVHSLTALDPSLTVFGFVGCRAVILWNSSFRKIVITYSKKPGNGKNWNLFFLTTISAGILSAFIPPTPESSFLYLLTNPLTLTTLCL